jgi:cellulose synthase/poly-beta-1,6-N-acetylglucosamine synthase-like glycosyltransferase
VNALDVVLAGLAAPSLACASYLAVLAAAARRRVHVEARDVEKHTVKFCVVVPAHDEEAGIASTVKSAASVDYPEEARRIVVVADNCKDETAARAEEAGAIVLVRTDTSMRGKGYALAFAFEKILDEGWADAVVVIDADTVVSPSLLHAFATRIRAGAHAVQADYAVRNREASWRTRLMVIALALFHVLRSLGRECLGLSAGLRGNGMAFTTKVLREVPHDAFSIVEDLEYGIRLGLAGHRVWYASEAHVYGEMVAGESDSRSQRRRWEQGRSAIFKQYAGKLLWMSIRKRSALLFDLAMDVIVPPLATLVLVTATGAIGTFVWWRVLHHALHPFVAWAIANAFIALYVLRGWMLSGVGARGLLDLCWAPVYVIWKLGLALRRPSHKKDEWVRTARGQS